MRPHFVDEENEAQKFKEIICTRSHTSLLAEFNHTFLGLNLPTWSLEHLVTPTTWAIEKRMVGVSHYKPVPLASAWYSQFLGISKLIAREDHGEKTNSQAGSPENPLQTVGPHTS